MFSLDRLSTASNQAYQFLNNRVINPLLLIDQRVFLCAAGIIACLLTIKFFSRNFTATEYNAEANPLVTQLAHKDGDGRQFIGQSNLVISQPPADEEKTISEVLEPAPSLEPALSLESASSRVPEAASPQALPEVPLAVNLMPIAALHEENEESLSPEDIQRIIYRGLQVHDEKLTEEKLHSLFVIMNTFQYDREFQRVNYGNTDPNCVMIDHNGFGMPNGVYGCHLEAFARYLMLKGFGCEYKVQPTVQGYIHVIYYEKVDHASDKIDEPLITKQALIDADRHVEALPKPDFSHLDQNGRNAAQAILKRLLEIHFYGHLNHYLNKKITIYPEYNAKNPVIMGSLVRTGVIHCWWASSRNPISFQLSRDDNKDDIINGVRDLALIEKEELFKRDNHIQIPHDAFVQDPNLREKLEALVEKLNERVARGKAVEYGFINAETILSYMKEEGLIHHYERTGITYDIYVKATDMDPVA